MKKCIYSCDIHTFYERFENLLDISSILVTNTLIFLIIFYYEILYRFHSLITLHFLVECFLPAVYTRVHIQGMETRSYPTVDHFRM